MANASPAAGAVELGLRTPDFGTPPLSPTRQYAGSRPDNQERWYNRRFETSCFGHIGLPSVRKEKYFSMVLLTVCVAAVEDVVAVAIAVFFRPLMIRILAPGTHVLKSLPLGWTLVALAILALRLLPLLIVVIRPTLVIPFSSIGLSFLYLLCGHMWNLGYGTLIAGIPNLIGLSCYLLRYACSRDMSSRHNVNCQTFRDFMFKSSKVLVPLSSLSDALLNPIISASAMLGEWIACFLGLVTYSITIWMIVSVGTFLSTTTNDNITQEVRLIVCSIVFAYLVLVKIAGFVGLAYSMQKTRPSVAETFHEFTQSDFYQSYPSLSERARHSVSTLSASSASHLMNTRSSPA